jgi:hypothetical protein
LIDALIGGWDSLISAAILCNTFFHFCVLQYCDIANSAKMEAWKRKNAGAGAGRGVRPQFAIDDN